MKRIWFAVIKYVGLGEGVALGEGGGKSGKSLPVILMSKEVVKESLGKNKIM